MVFHRFEAVVILSLVLTLSLSQVFGRKLITSSEHNEKHTAILNEDDAGESGNSNSVELDYVEAGPNTNPKSGLPSGGPPPQG